MAIFEAWRFENMLKLLAAITMVLSLLLLLQGQQHRPTVRPTGPMPAPLIP